MLIDPITHVAIIGPGSIGAYRATWVRNRRTDASCEEVCQPRRQVTICHATSSATIPHSRIVTSGTAGHDDHVNDIFHGEVSCPAGSQPVGTAGLYGSGVAGVAVTGISELVLEVLDLEAAERFYAGALGLPVVERWEQREAVWVMAGRQTRIGLWRPQVGIATGRGGVHVHYALHLSDGDYDGAVARLREHGYEPHEERFGAYDSSRAAYVTDPDGNVVELWTWDVSHHLEGRSQND